MVSTGSTHVVISPVTEQAVAEVPSSSLEDTDAAIERAQAAFAGLAGGRAR